MEMKACQVCGKEIPNKSLRITCSAECRSMSYVKCNTDEHIRSKMSSEDIAIRNAFMRQSQDPQEWREEMLSAYIADACKEINSKWSESERLFRAGHIVDPVDYDSVVGRQRHNGQTMERSQ